MKQKLLQNFEKFTRRMDVCRPGVRCALNGIRWIYTFHSPFSRLGNSNASTPGRDCAPRLIEFVGCVCGAKLQQRLTHRTGSTSKQSVRRNPGDGCVFHAERDILDPGRLQVYKTASKFCQNVFQLFYPSKNTFHCKAFNWHRFCSRPDSAYASLWSRLIWSFKKILSIALAGSKLKRWRGSALLTQQWGPKLPDLSWPACRSLDRTAIPNWLVYMLAHHSWGQ